MCNMIVDCCQPKKGTREWSDKSLNIQTGCENGCLYCYAFKNAIRFKRVNSYNEWIMPKLHLDKFKNNFRSTMKLFMFPTTHDITENNLTEAIKTIKCVIAENNRVLIVSKPRERVIRELCNNFQEFTHLIEFRFTIGSNLESHIKFWEPNAPSLDERLRCLCLAKFHHFNVSVSMEPLLQPSIEGIDEMINYFKDHQVKEVWIGAMNYTKNAPKLDYQQIYERFKHDSFVCWKESFRKHLEVVV